MKASRLNQGLAASLLVTLSLAQSGEPPPTTADPDTIKDCTWWRVAEEGDKCEPIASLYGITVEQLIDYNPILADSCTFVVGNSYCMEQNWGEGPSPEEPSSTTSSSSSTSTTSSTSSTSTTSTSTTTSESPSTPTSGNGIETPMPTQPSMVDNCNAFHFVEQGSGCVDIAAEYGISMSDFVKWNPSVKSTCTGLWAGVYVCVGTLDGPGPDPTPTQTPTPTAPPGNGIETPEPTQPNMVDNCNKFHFVEQGTGCVDIAAEYGISIDDFVKWNPSVKSTCTGLWAEVHVCVDTLDGPSPGPAPTTTAPPGNGIPTPTPIQPGMVKNCNKFDFVEPGNGCQDIADRNRISLAQFYAWNPEVGSTCGGLWAEVHVCVGVIGGGGPAPTPTTMSTSTRPGNGVPTPSPIQPGMVTNCDRFHKVVAGDTCYDIAAAAKITLANFYRWNPAVGSNCGGLWAEYYVCTSLI